MVFSILISMPFIGAGTVNSLFGNYINHQIGMGKDVFYRLKNKTSICWRLVLWLFCKKFINITINKSDNCNKERQVKCLIFDDSVLTKTGRFIEKISRVWDHVSGHYVLGFKLLLMGYWDGASFIPADFSMHRERGKNQEKPYGLKKREMKRQFNKKREKDSPCFERAKEADISKIDSAIKMFKRAIAQGFHVDFVLMDSWFTCDAFIDAVMKVKKRTVHLIGMYKIAKNQIFGIKDRNILMDRYGTFWAKP